MRRPGGYACIIDPDDGVRECDTFTCAHCQRITHVRAKARPEDVGGLCKCCMGLICPRCLSKPCVPFLKKLEQAEASYHARRSYGI